MYILTEQEQEDLLDIVDPNIELTDISEEGNDPLYGFKVKGVQYYFAFDEDDEFFVISDEEPEEYEDELMESDFGFMAPMNLED